MNTEVKKIRFHKGRAWQPKSEEGDRKRRSNLCTEDATGRKQRSGGQVWEMAARRPATACSLEEKEKEAMAETRTSAWETHLDLQLQQAPHLFCPQFPTHLEVELVASKALPQGQLPSLTLLRVEALPGAMITLLTHASLYSINQESVKRPAWENGRPLIS